MQQKNIFLMLALSGSMLMMMLVSVLFFVPTPLGLQANITSIPPVATISQVANTGTTEEVEDKYYTGREPDEILKTIQEYVKNNDPDTAKKLYDELYSSERKNDNNMGGEIVGMTQ
jgi:hypothetical protein